MKTISIWNRLWRTLFFVGGLISLLPQAVWAKDDIKKDVKTAPPKTWEQRFTFTGSERRGVFTKDPFLWIYNAEFAKRFGMPEKWIHPDLKGVEAAAWRRVPKGYEMCGWFGIEQACQAEYACQLEVYVDQAKHPLPWKTDRMVDIESNYRSAFFLSPQGDERYREQSAFHNASRSPFADPETGEEVMYFNSDKTSKGDRGGSMRLAGYDREAFPGLSLLVFNSYRCYNAADYPTETMLIRLDKRPIVKGQGHPMGPTLQRYHEFVLPEDFDRRIRDQMKEAAEAESEFYRRGLNFKKGDSRE